MCATCGCGVAGVRVFGPGQLGPAGHDHGTDHPHGHDHDHGDDGHGHEHGLEGRTVQIQQNILAKNDRLAEDNRAWLTARAILAVNLMSSPGAGKTTLLERTAREAGAGLGLTVIEGEQGPPWTRPASRRRAARSRRSTRAQGATSTRAWRPAGCTREPRPGSVLAIENVGNLVCPALFDLGEAARAALSSVTEGADKPIKYRRCSAARTWSC